MVVLFFLSPYSIPSINLLFPPLQEKEVGERKEEVKTRKELSEGSKNDEKEAV